MAASWSWSASRTLATRRKLFPIQKSCWRRAFFSLFGFVGSPQVTAVNAQHKDTDILLFGALAGADELRGSLYPNVYSIRLGYSEEAAVITRHAETLGMRKLAIVHAKDAESMAALSAP